MHPPDRVERDAGRSSSYPPPVSAWGHTWRTVVVLAVSALGWAELAPLQWSQARALFWIDLAAGLVTFVLMFFRRRHPLGIAAAVTLAGALSYSSAGPAVLVTVSLATRRRLPEIAVVGLLGFVAAFVFAAYQPVPPAPAWVNVTLLLAVTVALAALGMFIGSQRELMWTLQDRARRAEEQQAARMAQARAAERERIAREMHDVLAHRISLVAMHAGALTYRTDLEPKAVRSSAELIQSQAHEALSDLRLVLGVLRDDSPSSEEGTSLRPQPTLADLPCLVDEARKAGMVVTLRAERADAVPDTVGRAVYRVVQEGLTNARKHAPHAHADVEVTLGSDTVAVTVSNATGASVPQVPGAGLGLVGLRERVELAGGVLEHGASGRTFVLRATLPLHRETAPVALAGSAPPTSGRPA